MGDVSPLMFESDDENDAELKETKIQLEDELKSSPENKDCVVELKGHQLVERLSAILSGIPPPPAVTFPQYDVNEMLRLWEENKNMLDLSTIKGNIQSGEIEKDISKQEWPSVKTVNHYGVYYNRSDTSETLALLSSKYQERYVGNETSSCVSSFYSRSPFRTASAKKRARRYAWGSSPGRRLSHLARRRNTFSSANLQQSSSGKSSAVPNKKKLILMDNKKKVDVRKKTRNSTKKNSATKNAVKNQKYLAQSRTINPKRALFQSPESDEKTVKSRVTQRPVIQPQLKDIQRSKRALWPKEESKEDDSLSNKIVKEDKNAEVETVRGFNTNGKRSGEETNNQDLKKKCTRVLKFDEDSSSPKLEKMPVLERQVLSKLHKQKLLWAVSGALREKGIKMNHKYFQPCASELFNRCKTIWLSEYAFKPKDSSTSDKMLEIVKKFSSSTIDKVKAKLEDGVINNVEIKIEDSDTLVKKVEPLNVSDKPQNSKDCLLKVEQPVHETHSNSNKQSELSTEVVVNNSNVHSSNIERLSDSLQTDSSKDSVQKQFIDCSNSVSSISNLCGNTVDFRTPESCKISQIPENSESLESNEIASTRSPLLNKNKIRNSLRKSSRSKPSGTMSGASSGLSCERNDTQTEDLYMDKN